MALEKAAVQFLREKFEEQVVLKFEEQVVLVHLVRVAF